MIQKYYKMQIDEFQKVNYVELFVREPVSSSNTYEII